MGGHRRRLPPLPPLERVVETSGIELCTESFGDPGDPPILLVMGLGASMLWWEEGFCRMLADGGRFVIRYDHRDAGRSTTYAPGHPGYTGADVAADAARVLDGYAIPAAHLVGVSAGGAFAQLLALGRALARPDQHVAGNTRRADASSSDRGVRALRANGGGGLDGRYVGDRGVVAYQRVLAGEDRPSTRRRRATSPAATWSAPRMSLHAGTTTSSPKATCWERPFRRPPRRRL